jgi:FixJ family two-component response regulator
MGSNAILFVFRIRACRQAHGGDKFGLGSPATMNAATSNSSDQPTVFVVDDEPMLLELAVAILKPLGCKVRTFRDPEQALKEFAVVRPSVVITDYAMGRMSGMDLIRECRRLKPGQKMILLSGTVDAHVFADAPVKPDLFLTKPYQIQDFTEAIQSMIVIAG